MMTVSLLLDTATNDLTLDASGNLAVCSPPYSLAQDAACACKLWTGSYWYGLEIGIPYQQILGQPLNTTFLKSQWVAAALTVPGVVSAQAFITGFANRQVSGQIQVTDANGDVAVAAFTTGPGPGRLFLSQQSQSGFNKVMGVN